MEDVGRDQRIVFVSRRLYRADCLLSFVRTIPRAGAIFPRDVQDISQTLPVEHIQHVPALGHRCPGFSSTYDSR